MNRLFITIDYETVAGAAADISSRLIEPVNGFLALCDQFGARITLFFDVCEYWAYQEASSKGVVDMSGAVAAIKDQLRGAVRRGHDVQLHLHPQWLGWRFKEGRWDLSDNNRRVGAVPVDEVGHLIKRGKETIEEILRDTDPEYRCVAFRAGHLSIQPEEHVITALTDAGIMLESSVAPGFARSGGGIHFDFLDTPDPPVWRIARKVTEEDPAGRLWEIPLTTSLTLSSRKRALRSAIRSLAGSRTGPAAVPAGEALIDRRPLWDRLVIRNRLLGTADPASSLRILRKGARNHRNNRGRPLVMVGHPHELDDMDGLTRLLEGCREMGVVYSTFSDLAGELDAARGS